MAWVNIGGAVAGAAVSGMMSSGSGGGGGGGATQTATKEPWAAAVPWLTSNLQTGQDLQKYYQANPFNAIQQGAYQSLLGSNDYINQMTPGLLSQFSQSQGFDRNNPHARPQAIQFPNMQQMQPMQGLLVGGGQAQGGPMASLVGGMNQTQNPYMNGGIPAAVAPAPAAPAAPGTYNISTPQGLLDYVRTMGFDAGGSGG